MDVDGTLTDGKIYMGVDGECMKAFDIKDGYALHTLSKENGIIPVIITARKSPMVEHRCTELGVTEIHQGVMQKLGCLKGILEKYSSTDQKYYDLSNVAYIGDDLLDLQCMNPIKEAGGIVGCPLNAAKDVVSVCDFISQHIGGEGAVRDFVEYIIAINRGQNDDMPLEERCMEAAYFLTQLNAQDLSLGRHDVNDSFFYNVIEYDTTNEVDKFYESHRKYVDIQMLISGVEVMQVADVCRLQELVQYDSSKDCTLYKSMGCSSITVLRPNSLMILYPKDAHRSMPYHSKVCHVVKIVGKVRI